MEKIDSKKKLPNKELKPKAKEEKKVTPKKKKKDLLPKREEVFLNLEKVVFGRGACEVARILMGKNKVDYSPSRDSGDYLTVYNLSKVKVKGDNKDKNKIYYRHSGYPGGIKSRTFGELREKNYPDLFRKAVWGMLPKNRLRKEMIKRLTVKLGGLEIKKS